MYTENLEDSILLNESIISKCNSLKIITGFTDIECISRHLIALSKMKSAGKFSVEMILGMINSNGLSERKHRNIKNLARTINANPPKMKMPHFSCLYKHQGLDIHSKVYIWCKNNEPLFAFCGSANYSMNAFHKRRECMDDCNPQDALAYYKSLLPDTISSEEENVLLKLNLSKSEKYDETDEYNLENLTWDMFKDKTPIAEATVSLLVAAGDRTGDTSGLNWGFRKEGTVRNKNESYIPYNKKDKKEGFFPLKKSPEEKHNPLFKVAPNGFPPFLMRVAQDRDKGIHTAENNSLLGQFFREKLGVGDGTFITKEMLEKYGKTFVVFKKYADDLFTMEF